MVLQAEEEPRESVSMAPCDTSPPWVLWSHCQHVADYGGLNFGWGPGYPLITEVSSYMSSTIDSLNHSKFISFVLFNSSSHFQALQKICLTSHIRSMADLLHASMIQQLEVALLGSPAAQVIDLLSGGWMQTKLVHMTSVWCHPQTYTLPQHQFPVLGVSSSVSTELMPGGESLAWWQNLRMFPCQFQSVII